MLCTLHSQVAPVWGALAGKRVAYVQVDGGALPVSLSDAVRILKQHGLLGTAIAVAPCLDGDVDCVTAAAAFILAGGVRATTRSSAPSAPGLSARGRGEHSCCRWQAPPMSQRRWGRTVLGSRSSEADPRRSPPPWRLASHASRSSTCASGRSSSPGRMRLRPTAGRTPARLCRFVTWGAGQEEDPAFFRAAFAAGVVARGMLA